MKISLHDKNILRKLASEKAEIATLPSHNEKIKLWKKLNSLEKTRPLLWINQIPWEEMNHDGELTLICENEFCRSIEMGLRKTIYQWKHMPGDMIVEPILEYRISIKNSGFGIAEKSEKELSSGFASRYFEPQIKTEADIEKIKPPVISVDYKNEAYKMEFLSSVIGDILRIEPLGIASFWFAPWDLLVTWYGIEETMIDLVMKPDLIHLAMDKLIDAYLIGLKQYEEQCLLSLNNTNVNIGSGGLGYVDELPKKDYKTDKIRPLDQWGCAAAQIFSAISPKMHEEFALHYEKKWLEKFGLTYYGCCEPLHNKIEILKSIPNLRKISMSPWANVEKFVEQVGKKYVLSYKPNPAILARDEWNPQQAEKELREVLEKAKNCCVEVILKDISTVRQDYRRLWDWANIAFRTVNEY